VLDYTRLADRRACNCVVVAAQEILGIVKFGAGKPDGYFLECAFVEDLGFMLGKRASKMVAGNTLVGGLEYMIPRNSHRSCQNV